MTATVLGIMRNRVITSFGLVLNRSKVREAAIRGVVRCFGQGSCRVFSVRIAFWRERPSMSIEHRHPDIWPVAGRGSAMVVTAVAFLSERAPAVFPSIVVACASGGRWRTALAVSEGRGVPSSGACHIRPDRCRVLMVSGYPSTTEGLLPRDWVTRISKKSSVQSSAQDQSLWAPGMGVSVIRPSINRIKRR